MKHIWLWWRKDDVRTERLQLADEGRVTDSIESELLRLLGEETAEDAAFQHAFDALLDRALSLPVRADYPWVEPSDLAEIQAARPDGPRALAVDESRMADRIAGAWLGRCAGCLLGKPVEGVRWPVLRRLLDAAGADEIPDYLWRLPGLSDADFERLDLKRLSSWRSTDRMPEDDDTNYTVAGMGVVKAKGIGFMPSDAADFWMGNIPILHTCTAERAAYRNFVENIEPPASGWRRNPYREWIGAQIRADFFGYVAAGRPALAAELAWRDACISHIRNGIYGEMWVAAMLAAAAAEPDARRVIEIGLTEIPAKCRLAAAVRDVLSWHAEALPYKEAAARIHSRWDETVGHHWCHTISNAQIVALGLLYGGGDFGRSIARAVYPCLDTDCNGATVGSIAGMMLGARALPEKWTGVMNDTVETGLAGYHQVRISALAREMFELYRKHR